MWRRLNFIALLFVLFLLLSDEDLLPPNMSTDFKLSYPLDKNTNINLGVRTYDELEYRLNRGKGGYLDKFVIWFNINF